MEAWRSSCPRFTIWEDAIADGLIREESGNGGTLGELQVVLTPAAGRCSTARHRPIPILRDWLWARHAVPGE